MLNLNKDNFQENTKELTIVDFWAPWCAPCRMLGPIFEEVSKELTEITFARINTEENLELSQQNNITGIPCMIIFKDNKEIGRIVGLLPKESLKQKIQEFI